MNAKAIKSRFDGTIIFNCPGCKKIHQINVDSPRMGPDGPIIYEYNNNCILPTISPAIKRIWKKDDINGCCHSNIIDGKISFFPDTTHKLSGQTVDLISFTESKIRYWTSNPIDFLDK